MRARCEHSSTWNFETLKSKYVARLVEFLQVGAPLSLHKMHIRESYLVMDDLQNLIDQLRRLSPCSSTVTVQEDE